VSLNVSCGASSVPDRDFIATLLALTFIPLSAFTAREIFPSLKPPKYRPILFLAVGVSFFCFGILGAYALRPFLESGVVQFRAKRLGEIYADSFSQPVEFWLVVLLLYGLSVFVSGIGLAGCYLVLNNQQKTNAI